MLIFNEKCALIEFTYLVSTPRHEWHALFVV